MKLTVEIDNLTDAQAEALQEMFSMWMRLGGLGSSRYVAFYADGDGNFRPHVTVNGIPAVPTRWLTDEDRKKLWNRAEGDEVYWIDFDPIAWRMHGDEPSRK